MDVCRLSLMDVDELDLVGTKCQAEAIEELGNRGRGLHGDLFSVGQFVSDPEPGSGVAEAPIACPESGAG